ncbi:MAG: DUF3737 family protein [Abditibacteriota bacterium]|nr:DUF3737 family protein [Abditibacteriota bacterium]
MKVIRDITTDEERAFYGSESLSLVNCKIDGPADGESAIKECRDIQAKDCFFNLRYPFWHVHGVTVDNCELTELCRAAFWYTDGGTIRNSKLHGIKALRECGNITITDTSIISPEFGWFTRGCAMRDVTARGEYFMLRARDLDFERVTLKGKYSFQYVENAEIRNCVLDTKDAFWHTKNVTVRDSAVKGEYLAWYAENLTFVNCKISGTQPLCYCKNLKLIDCTMEGCDLSFEKSEVEATVLSQVDSVKNPKSGRIKVFSVGEIIRDDPESKGEIIVG